MQPTQINSHPLTYLANPLGTNPSCPQGKSWCPRVALILVIILLLFIASTPAWAHVKKTLALALTVEEKDWLDRNPDKLTLYYNVDFPPIEFSSTSGDFIGMGADIIAILEKKLGVTFIKQPSDDWNKHLAALKNGTCPIAPTIVSTPERQEYTFFTTPYATVPVVIITSTSIQDDLTIDNFTGQRVAVVSGYATETWLRDKARGRFEIVVVTNVTQGLRNVSFGQVDAFVENLAVAAYYIETQGIPNLRVAGSTDYSFAWSIGVSRRYPLLYTSIQKALDTVSERDINAIQERWISLDVNRWLSPRMRRIILGLGLFSALLILALLGISIILKLRLKEKQAYLNESRQMILDQSELLNMATEVTQAGAWDYRPATQTSYLSDNWCAMLGYPPREKTIPLSEMINFVHPDDQPDLYRLFETYISSGGKGQLEARIRMKRMDGTWCWVLNRGKTIAWDDTGRPTRIIGLDVNIQSIKDAQEKMEQSEARFRSLFLNAPIPMGNLALNGNLIAINDRFTEMFEYTLEEVQNADQWWEKFYPDPDYRRQARETWTKALQEAITNKTCVEPLEYRVTRKDGTVLTMIISGSITGDTVLISFFDITDRKQADAEREKLQEQLNQSQKLEAVGTLAGGVAHDFNNMIGAIMGYAELTIKAMSPDNPFQKNLNHILDAARRSANLTRQLLAFARKQTIEPLALDLNESIELLLKMLRRLIGENIELAWLPGKASCPVKMDPTQVDQILINMCVNARDAIEGVGRVTIETGTVSFDNSYCETHADVFPGEYALLAISDNGRGMDKETLNHVFEPFYTTKELGHGTGMGLATIYGIVKQNSGFINVYSELDKGTIFRICLPLDDTQKVTTLPKKIEAIPQGRGESLLIVEDDPILLELVKEMLEELGYRVISATKPMEAIRMAKENSIDIDLFITDMVMPEMNGRELAKQIQTIRPTIKHLLMSGYTADIIAHQGVLNKGVNFIQKPFSLKDIAVKLRSVLD